MSVRYELWHSAERGFQWALLRPDGEVVVASSQHPSRQAALRSIDLAREHAWYEPQYSVTETRGGRYHFTLAAPCGSEIARSVGYSGFERLRNGMAFVQREAAMAPLLVRS